MFSITGKLSSLLPDNEFINVKEFEFPESKDTVWTGNDIGNACVEDSADFSSGSPIPECK